MATTRPDPSRQQAGTSARAAGDREVIVVGAGIGGLTAAVLLAARGVAVRILERADRIGGKLATALIDGHALDTGPTVLTLLSEFEAIFADAGSRLDAHVKLSRLDVLARHAWDDGSRLDLFADQARSVDAITAFAGRREAEAYVRFCRDAQRTYETLDAPFMRKGRTNLAQLMGRLALRGRRGVADLWRLQPYRSMWSELGLYFSDRRLQQLFARYATYCGASPFSAPATLMLVAHLEASGVWVPAGGMHSLATAFEDLARRLDVVIETGVDVAAIDVDGDRVTGVRRSDGSTQRALAVVFNGDVAALSGLCTHRRAALPQRAIGPRTLSAVTLSFTADVCGMPLAHHTVLFSDDYRREFVAIAAGRFEPEGATVYVCAPDHAAGGRQRLFCLLNAPATGDVAQPSGLEIVTWQAQIMARLQRAGLILSNVSSASAISTPSDYHRRFPATGGALYGPAAHTTMAAFQRMGARSRLAGLYLAGGSLHPGPGLPMAARSGRNAARCLLADMASSARSQLAVMPGGTWMASATTAGTR